MRDPSLAPGPAPDDRGTEIQGTIHQRLDATTDDDHNDTMTFDTLTHHDDDTYHNTILLPTLTNAAHNVTQKGTTQQLETTPTEIVTAPLGPPQAPEQQRPPCHTRRPTDDDAHYANIRCGIHTTSGTTSKTPDETRGTSTTSPRRPHKHAHRLHRNPTPTRRPPLRGLT